MTPYHRLISAWVLLEKQKDIPKYLERLGLPEPETLPEIVKKPTRDETVSRFCRWFSGAEMDHDIDIVYYRLLPVVGTRKTLNTLLLLGYTPEALSPCRLEPSHTIANASLPSPHETGSTMVIAAAAAIVASIALPPAYSMRNPACAASG